MAAYAVVLKNKETGSFDTVAAEKLEGKQSAQRAEVIVVIKHCSGLRERM